MKKLLLVFLLMLTSVSIFSQPKKIVTDPDMVGFKYKNFWQLTVGGQFLEPMWDMKNTWATSGGPGLDVSYRINKEVAVFADFKYNILQASNYVGTPQGGYYLQGTVGPRIYFTTRCYRSSFFFEASIGGYAYGQDAYTGNDTVYRASTSSINAGANGGIGGELVFTNKLLFTMKLRYNAVFVKGGTRNFMDGFGGFTFRF